VLAVGTATVLVTGCAYVGYVARGALADAADLRAREARANGMRPRPPDAAAVRPAASP
jgi:hypothetical protein